MGKAIKKATAASPLPQEHERMIAAIMRLPDIEVQLWETNQQEEIENKRNFWRYIGMRIDYLQKVQAGFLLTDPLNDKELHPRQREYLDIFSRYKFAIFNVVIKGWSLIKDAAIREGRKFPFQNPRELFTEMCREFANDPVEDMTRTGVDPAPTLNAVRDLMTQLGKLCRRSLEEDKEKELLSLLRDSDWCLFWIFATQGYWFKKELRPEWQQFLDLHKNFTRFIKETKPREGTVLTKVRCHEGRTVHTNGKLAQFS